MKFITILICLIFSKPTFANYSVRAYTINNKTPFYFDHNHSNKITFIDAKVRVFPLNNRNNTSITQYVSIKGQLGFIKLEDIAIISYPNNFANIWVDQNRRGMIKNYLKHLFK